MHHWPGKATIWGYLPIFFTQPAIRAIRSSQLLGPTIVVAPGPARAIRGWPHACEQPASQPCSSDTYVLKEKSREGTPWRLYHPNICCFLCMRRCYILGSTNETVTVLPMAKGQVVGFIGSQTAKYSRPRQINESSGLIRGGLGTLS